MDRDAMPELVAQVRSAAAAGTALRIAGGDTKRFLGRAVDGTILATRDHAGILRHDPAELVVTVRSGTALADLEAALAAHDQCLAFEPPHLGPCATIGGTVACGLAGPARALSGPLRDHLLGVRILAGDGRVLRFGGEVMKNVAGYDVARLMAGSLGVLGVLLDVSLKVMPRPVARRTLALELDEAAALAMLADLARTALPLSASAWVDGRLYLRLDGADGTLDEVSVRIGGETVPDCASFWNTLREQTHPFFGGEAPLWRCTVSPLAPPMDLGPAPLLEWNAMQRWVRAEPGARVLDAAAAAGGHATLFRSVGDGGEVFSPLTPALLRLHVELKRVFDPAGILNPGRMYAGL